jgi:hypothetical protein
MGDTTHWMGVWLDHVTATASHWKELRTLLQMLEDLLERKEEPVRQQPDHHNFAGQKK